LIVVFFGTIRNNLFCQKKVTVFITNYKLSFYSKKESLAISNDKIGELVVLVEDVKKTSVFL